MKQHITYKQWMELDAGLREQYLEDQQNKCPTMIGQPQNMPYGSIGQMIEFLGDSQWAIIAQGTKREEHFYCLRIKPHEELCDSLWEATKTKLNNNVQPQNN